MCPPERPHPMTGLILTRVNKPPLRRMERHKITTCSRTALLWVASSKLTQFGHDEDRIPTHGYAESREEAMAASRKAGGGYEVAALRE